MIFFYTVMGKQFEGFIPKTFRVKTVAKGNFHNVKNQFLVLNCILALLFPLSSHGQSGDMKFTRLATRDGLLSNTVNAILKDNTGMLWIGTGQGLDKFDGEKFKVYRFESPGRSSFLTQEVKSLCLDKEGNLWAGVIGNGLYRYNRMLDKFERYIPANWHGQISSVFINKIICDHQNRLWLATVDGLNVIDFKKKSVKVYNYNPKTPGIIGANNTLTVFEDKTNKIWVGTNAGLLLLNQSTSTFSSWKHDDTIPSSLAGKDVNDIAEDQNGNIWVATNNGLSKLNTKTNDFLNFRYNYKNEQSISGNIAYRVMPEGKSHLWVGTEGGLDELDINSGQIVRYNYDERNPYTITNKSIRNIYFDGQGTCWLSTFSNGVVKFDKNLTLFSVVQARPYDPKGLRENFVNAFQEYNSGEIFVGTDGGGLDLFHLKSGSFDHLAITSRLKVSKRGLPVLCMKMDHHQNLWIGTYQNGLFRYQPQTRSYQQFTKGTDKGDIISNDIFCLNEDMTGKIWIGTNGDGVDIYDPISGSNTKFKPLPATPAESRIPLNGFIRAIEFDQQGNAWIGTWGSGFGIYSPKTGKIRIYSPENTHFPIDKIISMSQRNDGNMWLGTNGNGLYQFDVKSEKITAIKEGNNAHEVIHKILEDNSGIIWYSTDNGLKSYDPLSKRFAHYTQANGLQNTSFQNGSGLKASSGTLLFGGSNGFNYFTAIDVKRNTIIPPVVLTGLQLNNTPVIPGKNAPIEEDISVAKVIHLDYKQSFSISYAALNYTLPAQNSYAVMLKGLDQSWNAVRTLKTAYYTNLDPGEYTFMVKAANNDGVWNNVGTSVKIIVSPPWWRTNLAYLCYVAFLLSVLWLLRRQGIKKIEMRQQEKQAKALHELDLMKIKFLTNLSHEFRTPISLILSPVEKLLNQYNDSQLTSQLQVVRRNGKRLLNLVNQLLDFRKLEENELTLIVSDGEMVSFIKDLADSFRDLSASKKIDLIFNGPESKFFARFDPEKIERIMFNLLSNAFKFTPEGGRIAVNMDIEPSSLNEDNNTVVIIVTDTGIGIPKEKLDLIFDRFYQTDELPSAINQGTGIGLSISKELAEMHGGTITVTSISGKGTTFTLSIPVERSSKHSLIETPGSNKSLYQPIEKTSVIPIDGDLLHVLIVEDNTELRHYLSDSLRNFYKVTEAADGNAGWQKALSSHPNLIISDISMPYMDGITLSKKLKGDKRTNHIPIILLTALTSQANLLEGLETGASDYLTKPFDFEVLNLKIRNLLKLNSSLKETYTKQFKVLRNDVEIESSSEIFLKSVVSYVEENMNNVRFSVDELSHHFNMSRGTLYYKILELTGLPPVEFMRTIKLDKAVIMLEKSDLSVSQIAYATGFATPHYFTKSFKAKFNVLPKDYRKKVKAKEDQELVIKT